MQAKIRKTLGAIKRQIAEVLVSHLPGSSETYGPPRGYYASLDELLDNNLFDIQKTKVFAQEVNIYSSARTLELIPHWKFDGRYNSFNVKAEYVYHLSQARVAGLGAAVITCNDKIVLSCSSMWGAYYDPLFFSPKLPALSYVPGLTVLLANVPGENISHFVMDCLPRLQSYLSAFSQKQNSQIRFVVNGKNNAYIKALLDVFGVPEPQRIYAGDNLHIKCEELVVFNNSVHGEPTKRFIQFFQERCTATLAKHEESPRRIYVSRELASYRKIKNSQEVEGLLSDYGFTKVMLEQLTFQEQANLFYNADVVFTPHGAGLINIIYCRPNTKVIELLAKEHVDCEYWSLASQCDLEYYYLISQGDRPNDEGDYFKSWTSPVDMVCNINALKKTLRLVTT